MSQVSHFEKGFFNDGNFEMSFTYIHLNCGERVSCKTYTEVTRGIFVFKCLKCNF